MVLIYILDDYKIMINKIIQNLNIYVIFDNLYLYLYLYLHLYLVLLYQE